MKIMNCFITNQEQKVLGGNEMKYYRIGWKEDCECENAHWIGRDGGNNEYYKCDDCDAVIIKSELGAIEEGQECEMMEEEPTCIGGPEE